METEYRNLQQINPKQSYKVCITCGHKEDHCFCPIDPIEDALQELVDEAQKLGLYE